MATPMPETTERRAYWQCQHCGETFTRAQRQSALEHACTATNWRDEFKAMEQAYMVLKDQYAEIAIILGAPANAFWGDPLWDHASILQRAKELANG